MPNDQARRRRTARRLHQPAAILQAFARGNFVLSLRDAVSQTLRKRHEHMIADALRATAENAKRAA